MTLFAQDNIYLTISMFYLGDALSNQSHRSYVNRNEKKMHFKNLSVNSVNTSLTFIQNYVSDAVIFKIHLQFSLVTSFTNFLIKLVAKFKLFFNDINKI